MRIEQFYERLDLDSQLARAQCLEDRLRQLQSLWARVPTEQDINRRLAQLDGVRSLLREILGLDTRCSERGKRRRRGPTDNQSQGPQPADTHVVDERPATMGQLPTVAPSEPTESLPVVRP